CNSKVRFTLISRDIPKRVFNPARNLEIGSALIPDLVGIERLLVCDTSRPQERSGDAGLINSDVEHGLAVPLTLPPTLLPGRFNMALRGLPASVRSGWC